MPIDPKKYPKDWQQISDRIRFDRANGACEWCGVGHHAVGWRDRVGNFHPEISGETGWTPGYADRIFRVVLTVAHLDRDPTNNAEENLAALCQRCHLNHDRIENLRTASRSRQQREGQTRLFPEQAILRHDKG